MRSARQSRAVVFAALAFMGAPFAVAQVLTPHQQLARDIHKELVEINTVTATGDTLHGTGARKPILLLAHLDVVEAKPEDEEILDHNAMGIQWLLKNHRDLIDAELALNEGGGVGLKNGKPLRNGMQTSEKVSFSYRLEVKNRGGHSSLPTKDNAIYHLAEGLRLQRTAATCATRASRRTATRAWEPISSMFAFTEGTSASWSNPSTTVMSICTGW